MKKFLKITGIVVLVILVAIACVALYVKTALPNVGPAEELTIERTQARIERGDYLANNVTVCMDCHSQRDYNVFAAPIKAETLGAGGEKFDKETGFPGTVFSKNITPYGLGTWKDGEIVRAITTGVTKNGNAIFPLMPYHSYGRMDKEDVYSIVAYLRTLPEIKNEVPAAELDFPLNFIVNTIPEKASFTPRPDTGNSIKYGEYLVNAAACANCHGAGEHGNPNPETQFAGGMEFKQPGGLARSANLTPDDATGLGLWTKETFVKRFKTFADSSHQPLKLSPGDLNTPMPWYKYGRMTEKDLGCIYDYLRTVKPVKNAIIKFQKTPV